MRRSIILILSSMVAFSTVAFAHNCDCDKKQVMEKKMSHQKMMKKSKPANIDKNNVGITSGEKLDQSDPTLIEGNLEDNDFKN